MASSSSTTATKRKRDSGTHLRAHLRADSIASLHTLEVVLHILPQLLVIRVAHAGDALLSRLLLLGDLLSHVHGEVVVGHHGIRAHEVGTVGHGGWCASASDAIQAGRRRAMTGGKGTAGGGEQDDVVSGSGTATTTTTAAGRGQR